MKSNGDIFSDNFCIIKRIENTQRAIYADMSLTWYEMPLLWAIKAAGFLKEGNYKKGLHMIDMIDTNYKKGVTV